MHTDMHTKIQEACIHMHIPTSEKIPSVFCLCGVGENWGIKKAKSEIMNQ